MSRIGKLPITIPSGVQVDVTGNHVKVTGPKGTLERDVAPELRIVHEDGIAARGAAQRREALARAARPDPNAAQQHGRRRDRRLPQGPRDHRCRLPRPARGQEAAAQPGLQPPDRDRSAGRRQLRGREPDSPRRRRSSTRSWSATWPREFASTRKPEPYKGKGVRYAGEIVRRKAGKAGKIGGKK